MADLGVTYPSEPVLLAVAVHVPGLTTAGALNPNGVTEDGIGWAVTPGFPLLEPTGETEIDAFGNTVPVMRQIALYRCLRWNGDPAELGSRVAAAGGSMVVDPVTGAITIHAGPVTMISPPPENPPVTF